jgi:hypothetical protein
VKGFHTLAVMVLGLSLLLTATAMADDTAMARGLANKGQKHFNRGEYDAAIAAFSRAYELKPHFLMQCNIARCHEMKEELKEARDHYKRCLDEGGSQSPTADQVRQALAAVEEKLPPEDETPDSKEPTAPASVPARPFFAQAGFGAGIGITNVKSQAKLSLLFGYHFMGRFSGPALALDFQVGFGSDFTSIEIGPRFFWNIPLAPHLGLYLAPTAMLGYAHLTERCTAVTPALDVCEPGRNGLSFQLGLEVRLLLAERVLLAFQPVGVDVLGVANGDLDLAVRYDLMFSGGIVF